MNRFPSFRSLSLYKGATRQFSSFLSRAASPPLVYIYVHLLLLLLLFVYIINTFTELLFNNSSYTWKVAQHNHADVAVPLSISFTKSFWWYYINFLFSIIIFHLIYVVAAVYGNSHPEYAKYLVKSQQKKKTKNKKLFDLHILIIILYGAY